MKTRVTRELSGRDDDHTIDKIVRKHVRERSEFRPTSDSRRVQLYDTWLDSFSRTFSLFVELLDDSDVESIALHHIFNIYI